MFTGLIQQVGTLCHRAVAGDSGRLEIDGARWPEPLVPGESIAVEGVCLTLVEQQEQRLFFDVLAETFHRTNLAWKAIGAPINLERAITATQRLGGHIVNGHVDGVGEVGRFVPAGRDWMLAVSCDDALMAGIVYKGCIAVNGVSLTVAAVRDDTFEIYLIPETIKRTSLSELKSGHPVNLEIDVIGKYVRHYVEQGRMPEPVEWERLRVQGLVEC